MNNQYDTNGFSELINGIDMEKHLTEFKNECAQFGGSREAFNMMHRLEFSPIDEYNFAEPSAPSENEKVSIED